MTSVLPRGGWAENRPDDVQWVQRRLILHGQLTREAASTAFDSQVQQAIVAFQQLHGRGADGVVSPPRGALSPPDQDSARRTFNLLRKTVAELSPSAASRPSWARLAARCSEPTPRAVESARVTRVVHTAGTRVQAGEALWLAPQPEYPQDGATPEQLDAALDSVPQDLHWELFSTDEAPLIAAWQRRPRGAAPDEEQRHGRRRPRPRHVGQRSPS